MYMDLVIRANHGSRSMLRGRWIEVPLRFDLNPRCTRGYPLFCHPRGSMAKKWVHPTLWIAWAGLYLCSYLAPDQYGFSLLPHAPFSACDSQARNHGRNNRTLRKEFLCRIGAGQHPTTPSFISCAYNRFCQDRIQGLPIRSRESVCARPQADDLQVCLLWLCGNNSHKYCKDRRARCHQKTWLVTPTRGRSRDLSLYR